MRTLEGSDRVRNGVMGIIILVIVIGVGQSFASVPMLFATPTYYAQFSDTGGINNGDKVRIAGVDVGQVRSMEIDGDKVVIGYSLDGTQIGTDSRAAIRTDTILGRRNIEIEPRGSTALKANGILPLGPDHHAVPDLRRVLRCDRGIVGLGYADREAVAERVVGDHRPDLSAPERRTRRCGAVLRDRRQARRPDQATAGQRQPDRRHPRQPQRADQQAPGQRPVTVGRHQRTPVRGQRAVGTGGLLLRTAEGLHRRQSEPQPRARAVADHHRRPDRTPVRPDGHALHGRQLRGIPR